LLVNILKSGGQFLLELRADFSLKLRAAFVDAGHVCLAFASVSALFKPLLKGV